MQTSTYGAAAQHIRFKVDGRARVLKGGGGGTQLAVIMLIGTARLTEFSIDLSLEDIINPARETLAMRPIIEGLPTDLIAEVSTDELMFAEKLHVVESTLKESSFSHRPLPVELIQYLQYPTAFSSRRSSDHQSPKDSSAAHRDFEAMNPAAVA